VPAVEPEPKVPEPEISNQVAAEPEPVQEEAPAQLDQPMQEPESSFQVIEQVEVEEVAPAVVEEHVEPEPQPEPAAQVDVPQIEEAAPVEIVEPIEVEKSDAVAMNVDSEAVAERAE